MKYCAILPIVFTRNQEPAVPLAVFFSKCSVSRHQIVDHVSCLILFLGFMSLRNIDIPELTGRKEEYLPKIPFGLILSRSPEAEYRNDKIFPPTE